LDATEAQQCSPTHSCSPSKQQLLLLNQHYADLDSRQQQQLQQRPTTAGAGTGSSPTAVDGWDALRQQSHVLLADNEQLQRDNRLLQKQKEQLQAKVGS
jgi:predicted GNAT family N-acyltransferase